jgi:hypothetical protein
VRFSSLHRIRCSPHVAPVVILVAVFAISRGAIRIAGVRFDTGPLAFFWQYADFDLLEHDLLRSLWYLHSQPPLYNLWLGLNLKAFSRHLGPAIRLEYLACGLALALLLYALLVRTTARRKLALVLACIVAVSPSVLLYENWLFYEYPVTVLLLASLLALDGFVHRRSFAWGFAFFTLIAMVIYTRSTFQVVWALMAVLLLLWAMPGARKLVLLTCLVPMTAIVLLYVKNEVVFGVPATSSWGGMNLAQVAYADLSPSTRRRLIADGTLSKTSTVDPFTTLEGYPDFLRRTRRTGIPVLDERRKRLHLGRPERGPANYSNNFNNLAYVEISKAYLHDALGLIRARPGIYLDGVGDGLYLFFQPASDDGGVAPNRRKIQAWDSVFNAGVLWKIPSVSPIAWGLVLAYLVAGGYGLVLVRRFRRGAGAERERLAVLLFAWGTLIYVTLVITFGEVLENQRLRFCLDPLVLVLDTVAVLELLPSLKRTLRQSNRVRSTEPARASTV